MKNSTLLSFIIFSLLFTTTLVKNADAQDFVYQPLNPAFGGNPGNYSWLMNSANVQNLHEEVTADRLRRDPLEDFQASLQRQVLSQLTRDLVRREFGEGSGIEEGRFEFGEFTIDITPGPDGVSVTIFNILTGDETSVTIPSF